MSKAVYKFKKAPRSGSKLDAALSLVVDTIAAGTTDRSKIIEHIATTLGVTKGNASIYYAKSLALIEFMKTPTQPAPVEVQESVEVQVEETDVVAA